MPLKLLPARQRCHGLAPLGGKLLFGIIGGSRRLRSTTSTIIMALIRPNANSKPIRTFGSDSQLEDGAVGGGVVGVLVPPPLFVVVVGIPVTAVAVGVWPGTTAGVVPAVGVTPGAGVAVATELLGVNPAFGVGVGLLVVAVGVGDGRGVAVGVGIGVAVGVLVTAGVGIGVSVTVGLGTGMSVAVTVSRMVAVFACVTATEEFLVMRALRVAASVLTLTSISEMSNSNKLQKAAMTRT